jgi:hypothetical protein
MRREYLHGFTILRVVELSESYIMERHGFILELF